MSSKAEKNIYYYRRNHSNMLNVNKKDPNYLKAKSKALCEHRKISSCSDTGSIYKIRSKIQNQKQEAKFSV